MVQPRGRSPHRAAPLAIPRTRGRIWFWHRTRRPLLLSPLILRSMAEAVVEVVGAAGLAVEAGVLAEAAAAALAGAVAARAVLRADLLRRQAAVEQVFQVG